MQDLATENICNIFGGVDIVVLNKALKEPILGYSVTTDHHSGKRQKEVVMDVHQAELRKQISFNLM
jgi:hypothetical protein